jgi:glycine/serine hydroxymethyltransferase
MREPEMRRVAELIDQVLARAGDDAVARRVRAEVQELASQYPLYLGVEEAAARL